MAGEEGFTQGKSSGHVLETPLWMSLIRGAQVLIALIVLGLGVAIAKDVYFTQPGLAIAMVCTGIPKLPNRCILPMCRA